MVLFLGQCCSNFDPGFPIQVSRLLPHQPQKSKKEKTVLCNTIDDFDSALWMPLELSSPASVHLDLPLPVHLHGFSFRSISLFLKFLLPPFSNSPLSLSSVQSLSLSSVQSLSLSSVADPSKSIFLSSKSKVRTSRSTKFLGFFYFLFFIF